MRARWAVLIVALGLAACSRGPEPLRVGRKAFVEQHVLAELVRVVVEARGAGPVEVVNCGDTFGCQQALRTGDVDVVVEYTGTGHLYSSAASTGEPVSLAQLRRAYEPLGLTWMDPLGFDNGYRVVMPVNQATGLEVESIADLARVAGGQVRVAVPPTYLRRPGDGLAALLQRHGLRLRGEPFVSEEVDVRLDALRSGRVDIAVVYATDGALRARELVALRDSLGFFPPYDAAVLARREVLEGRPQLREALSTLSGAIDDAAMQSLNHAVQIEGWAPQAVARRFARRRGLSASEAPETGTPPLTIAVAERDELGSAVERATRATRETFPDRPVAAVPVSDPAEAVARGTARLAVLGAERFFAANDRRPDRERRIEAVAVVGSRLVHLVRRAGDVAGLTGRVGIEPAGTGAGRVGADLLRAAGLEPARRASRAALVDSVAAGELDAALLVAEAGASDLVRALDQRFGIGPLTSPSAAAVPYLRPARIPPGTYPGQQQVVETLGVQVVIAGPSRRATPRAVAGPAAALLKASAPLSLSEAEALVQATGVPETPDPVLPSAWTTWPERLDIAEREDARPSWVQTVINLLTLAFLVWLVLLVGRSDLGASRTGS